MRTKCAGCGEWIRRSQLTGRWTHVGPYLAPVEQHDARPIVINGHFDVEPTPPPTEPQDAA